MKTLGALKRVTSLEFIGFLGAIVLVWVNEVFDLPHVLLGAASTPINYREAALETVLLALLGAKVILSTARLLRRVTFFEGLIPICASCKRIRNERGEWFTLEEVICSQSGERITHGLCPDCLKKLYPE